MIAKSVGIVMFVLFVLSCRTIKDTSIENKIEYRDRYIKQIQNDSVYIEKRDTMYMKNDTIYLKSIVYKYIKQLKTDTILKTDSIYIYNDNTTYIKPTFIEVFMFYLKGFFIGVILSIISLVLYKLFK